MTVMLMLNPSFIRPLFLRSDRAHAAGGGNYAANDWIFRDPQDHSAFKFDGTAVIARCCRLILVIVVFVTVVMVGLRLRRGGGDTQFGARRPSARPGRAAAASREQACAPGTHRAGAGSDQQSDPLSPADVSRTRAWLIQAGFRDAIDVNYYFGARILTGGNRLCRRRPFYRIRQSFPSGRRSWSGIFSPPLHSQADDSETASIAFASACPTPST